MKPIKVNIFERVWKVSVLSGDEFQRRFEGESDGIMLPQTLTVYINEDALNLPTLRHELTHVLYDSVCVSSAELSLHQQEEVFCEINATYGPWIDKMARKLYKALKKAYG